jgi:hypothetical protein
VVYFLERLQKICKNKSNDSDAQVTQTKKAKFDQSVILVDVDFVFPFNFALHNVRCAHATLSARHFEQTRGLIQLHGHMREKQINRIHHHLLEWTRMNKFIAIRWFKALSVLADVLKLTITRARHSWEYAISSLVAESHVVEDWLLNLEFIIANQVHPSFVNIKRQTNHFINSPGLGVIATINNIPPTSAFKLVSEMPFIVRKITENIS